MMKLYEASYSWSTDQTAIPYQKMVQFNWTPLWFSWGACNTLVVASLIHHIMYKNAFWSIFERVDMIDPKIGAILVIQSTPNFHGLFVIKLKVGERKSSCRNKMASKNW